MNITIFVFRHGESISNYYLRLLSQGKGSEVPDSYFKMSDHEYPLTEFGEKQAMELQKAIAEPISSHKILPVTSPYLRAQQTARIVSKNLDWQIEGRFAERDFGDIHSFRERFGQKAVDKEFKESFTDPDYRPFVNGKTFRETVVRVKEGFEFWQQIALEYKADAILISAHGEVLRAFRAIAHRIELENYNGRLSGMVYNCQFDHFSVTCPQKSGTSGVWYRTLIPPYSEFEWKKIQ